MVKGRFLKTPKFKQKCVMSNSKFSANFLLRADSLHFREKSVKSSFIFFQLTVLFKFCDLWINIAFSHRYKKLQSNYTENYFKNKAWLLFEF